MSNRHIYTIICASQQASQVSSDTIDNNSHFEFQNKLGTMGLIHTPRTIYSILNGVYKRQMFLRQEPTTLSAAAATAVSGTPKNTMTIALGPTNPHIYQARLGLFDIDYLGHMNNGMLYGTCNNM